MAFAQNPESLRAYLRAGTRADHDNTEAVFAPFDVTTANGLAGFLTAHLLAIEAVEAALGGMDWPKDLPSLPPASEMILADLAALGHARPAIRLDPVAASDPVGPVYVLAGSRMGNRLIRKHVARNGTPETNESLTYIKAQSLDLHGQKVLNALDQLRVADRPACLAGARATFVTFAAAAQAAAHIV
ncbi:biliverdin-producing heme oxygenase [Pacificimonas sp. ICDLI1SI03]